MIWMKIKMDEDFTALSNLESEGSPKYQKTSIAFPGFSNTSFSGRIGFA